MIWSRFSRKGASSRLRHLQYLPYLIREGMSVETSHLLPDAYLDYLYSRKRQSYLLALSAIAARLLKVILFRFRRFDIVIIEKELFPYVPAFFEKILLWKIPYILDFDDATFHTYDLHSSPIVRGLLGHKIDVLMANARAVTVGSSYLAEQARRAGAPHVVSIPTVIDLTRYDSQTSPTDSDPPIIGWCGTPMTIKYLECVLAPLQALASRRTFRLRVIGADRYAPGGLDVESLPWSEATEVGHLSGCAIGIMPLADGPWERGKCGYKLIQFMALGIPVIASAVGANTQIVEHGKSGFLAQTPEEWSEYLELLLTNPDLRKTMGAHARERVAAQYCLQVTAPLLRGVIADCAQAAKERVANKLERLS